MSHYEDDDDNMTDDEDFIELAVIVAFPRKKKCFLSGPIISPSGEMNNFLIVFDFLNQVFISF